VIERERASEARTTATVDTKPCPRAMLTKGRAHGPSTGAKAPSSARLTAWCIASRSKRAS